jgi:hypothetical protein
VGKRRRPMTDIELEDLLELGPVRCTVDGVLKQYTRDAGTADTCNCYTGLKQCGFISELDWRDMLLSLDTEERIAVWEMQSNLFFTITAEEIDTIIGHGLDEPEEVSSCCSKME